MHSPRRGSTIHFLVPLVLLSSRPLSAQLSWSGHLGATYTTTMITDQIAGSVIKLAPGISPTVSLEGALPLRTKTPLRATAEVQLVLGTLQRKEGGTTTDVSSLRTVALTGGISGRLAAPLRWRAGIGLVSYALSEKAGVFQDGRPIRPLGTAAIEYRRELTPTLTLTGLLRYDIHGFITRQQQANGYTGSQTVHRVSLGVGVSR